MKKRLLALAMVLVLALSLLPGAALADNIEIIQIGTADELMAFAAAVNAGEYINNADVLVELTADIDMTGLDWTPIDVYIDPYFFGTFDGNDHTISGLTIDNVDVAENFGLFGSTACTIRDVHVSGEFVDKPDGLSDYWFGSIAGYTNGDIIGCTADFTIKSEDGVLRGVSIGGIVGEILGLTETVTLENCVSNTTITGKLSGTTYVKGAYVGGVCGCAGNVEIINCRNNGDITITDTGDFGYIGGIVGQTWAYESGWSDTENSPGVVLNHCVNNGDIVNSASANIVSIGGIGGRIVYSSTVICCTNNGAVSAVNNTQGGADAGGIIGSIYYGNASEIDALVESCLNNGTISGDGNTDIAGLVCQCGSSGTVIIRACISLGTLDAPNSDNVHPVLAVSSSSTLDISGNYYDELLTVKGNTPQAVLDGSAAMALADMKTDEFIQLVNSEGGNFRLSKTGEIEVIPLQYQVTIIDSYSDASGAGLHEENEVVSIDAGSRSGYRFDGWFSDSVTLADPDSAQTTFVMTDHPVTITATWVRVPSPSYKVTVEDSDGGSVTATPSSASKGLTITVKIKTDEGYTFDELTVTDASGNKLELFKRSGTEYSFSMPGSAVTVKASFDGEEPTEEDELPFDDVRTTDWFYDAVEYVWENELMNGVADDEFDPNATLTRSMMVTLLWRLEGEPVVNYLMPFDDVDEASWYGEAVRWAASEGIVTGVSENSYAPNDPITREQLAAILYRYAQYKEMDVSVGEDTNILSYADFAEISEYAIPAIQWATGSGLMNGVTDSELSPQGTATRAQVATMMMRFIESF